MIKSWFPTPIYSESLLKQAPKKLLSDLLKECYQIQEVDSEGRQWSLQNYCGGYTSYSSMGELHLTSPHFAELELHLRKHVRKFSRHLEFDLRGHQLEMTSFWVNIMPPQSAYHSWHIHPLATISGTFYLSVPRHSGKLKFEDPRLSRMMAAPPKKVPAKDRNRTHIEHQPQRGEVVLFESWLSHEVPQNQGTADRVSVSFNYHWS